MWVTPSVVVRCCGGLLRGGCTRLWWSSDTAGGSSSRRDPGVGHSGGGGGGGGGGGDGKAPGMLSSLRRIDAVWEDTSRSIGRYVGSLFPRTSGGSSSSSGRVDQETQQQQQQQQAPVTPLPSQEQKLGDLKEYINEQLSKLKAQVRGCCCAWSTAKCACSCSCCTCPRVLSAMETFLLLCEHVRTASLFGGFVCVGGHLYVPNQTKTTEKRK